MERQTTFEGFEDYNPLTQLRLVDLAREFKQKSPIILDGELLNSVDIGNALQAKFKEFILSRGFNSDRGAGTDFSSVNVDLKSPSLESYNGKAFGFTGSGIGDQPPSYSLLVFCHESKVGIANTECFIRHVCFVPADIPRWVDNRQWYWRANNSQILKYQV